jgi:hypothetical protein
MVVRRSLTEEVATWADDRNKRHAKADWHFSAAGACVTLKKLCPTL